MTEVIQSIINGLMMGAMYGLTALGLTLIFGVMKVINFAHGSLLMVGMFSAYWLIKLTGIHPYLALIIVPPILYFFGYYLQDVVIKPVFKSEREVREPATVIIVTTGVWYVLDNLALMCFGAEYRTVRTAISNKSMALGPYIVSIPKFSGFVVAILTAVGLALFMRKTKIGMALRATALDREAANLMGIDQYKVYNIAFGLGTAIAGIAGCVLIPFYYVYPSVGVVFDIRAFIIVVLGGLGSIPGALLGGLVIGLVESVFSQFMASTWTEAIIYAIFLIILFVKPSGFFGNKQDW
ncbi:branched-chain amino acid ABC transporter permease [Desulfovibrio sp. JY]|uniref:Inner-membrane translocator n=1 Tax=Solidesulfovibrio fructosivorans JJ] TaxID=596151 RepID=E1JXZ7_SOLFR|nr:branched-chain amino acid ABC transporter permease [Solidesulfovibrio fructosivorans]EFL50735.1 inner-membrane translocator [Solidesulfovibrio fructosivorans JJ]]UJX40916.1 branched-chain amino acid ABC transporter permease [Desulfovibrio sp. JY]